MQKESMSRIRQKTKKVKQSGGRVLFRLIFGRTMITVLLLLLQICLLYTSNKTSSAIRITHLPTGIVVQCQNERSQHMNKDKAMQMLRAKLYMLKQEANAEKLSDIRGEVTEIGWGNQIRSYVMQPYTMVKDTRTGAETGNVDAVLDGDIDKFINAYLKWKSLGD